MAMGSPVSPIVCNLFMEDLEHRAITTAPADFMPQFWKRYVDDVLAKIKKHQEKALEDHLNQVDPTKSIQFTHEKMENNTIPMLDVKIVVLEDGSIKTEVYRKATHTNHYLHFTSHHPLSQRMGVVRTLLDRARTVVSLPEDLEKEENTISQALRTCHYPAWAITNVQKMSQQSINKTSKGRPKKSQAETTGGQITLPYVKGLSENIASTLRKHRISTSYKPLMTIRRLLVHPKDKVEDAKKTGVVYKIPCGSCPKVYIGETGRKLETRLSEHESDVENNINTGVRTRTARLASTTEEHDSAITDHLLEENHVPNWQPKIMAREPYKLDRKIMEAITIQRHPNNVNRMDGAYQLSHIYDSLLLPYPPNPSRGAGGKGQSH